MRRLFGLALALLAILFVAAPQPVIADTVKSGSEPVLTITIASRDGITLVTVFRDDTESAMATWTSFQRDGLTISATAIPVTSPLGPATATLRSLTPDMSNSPHWRLADCTGTPAHDGTTATDTLKPTGTALIVSASGGLLGPLRR